MPNSRNAVVAPHGDVTPNVLLVVLDTARADALEPYGAKAGASPALAQLARRGQVAPYTVAPANWTVPSHASMFTGLLPRDLGLAQAPGGHPSECRPLIEAVEHRLLPSVLRASGYATAAVSTNLWVSPETGFDVGFDRFEMVSPSREAFHRKDLKGRVQWTFDGLRAKLDDGAAQVERLLDDWCSSRPRRPFFWFVNLIECHSPYLPPKPYNPLGPIGRMWSAVEAQRDLTFFGILRVCSGGRTVPPGALARMRRLYAAAVRLMDDWTARVLETMDRYGVLDDTLVVVTSDHGENFGEGGLIGHALSLDDRLTRVPLISAGPVTLDAAPVSSLAEVPTLLARAIGVPGDAWQDATPAVVDGAAIAQHDRLAAADDPRAIEAVADMRAGDEGLRRISSNLTSASDGRWKLVMNDDDRWVFDLAADPLEATPKRIDDAPPDVRTRLSAAVDAAGPGQRAVTPPSPLASLPSSATSHPDPDIELDALEEQMRLLGYL